jgi:hypothetical protein
MFKLSDSSDDDFEAQSAATLNSSSIIQNSSLQNVSLPNSTVF